MGSDSSLITKDAGISVIFPCLNEGEAIHECVLSTREILNSLDVNWEILVVDNGSNDNTASNALSAGARVIYCEQRGYGAAISFGVEHARFEYVLVCDGDGSYDLSRLGLFIFKLKSGCDFVIGNRINQFSPLPGAMPWHHRWIGNPLLTCIFNFLFKAKIDDLHCGLKGFRKKDYVKIRPVSSGFEACTEIAIRAISQNMSIDQVDIVLKRAHPGRKSKLRSLRDGLRHLFLTLSFALGDGLTPRSLKVIGII